jgi:MFS family permease
MLGIVGNGTTQLAYARVVSAWFDRRRGQALAAVMTGSGLGSMVFPPVAQAVISAYGWRTAYAVLGATILFVAIPMAALFLREPDEKASFHPEAVKKSSAMGSIWSAPFLGIAAALLLFSFATNGLNTHWAALLTDRGATAERAAFILSIAGAAALFSKLGTGYLLDRFRAGRAAAVLLGLCALGFVLILRGYQWQLSIASAILVGIGMGAESDVVPYLLTRYFGLERFGALYGYTWFVYAVAGATGPVAMGAVFDRTGSYHTLLVISLVMVVAAAAIFASLPGYRVPAKTADELRLEPAGKSR